MNIDRPIFIIGPHRSGTTLLYEILARHPDAGYFNRLNKRFPKSPGIAHLLTRSMKGDMPMEAQKIWDLSKYCDTDVMDASNASPEIISYYQNLIEKVLKLRGAKRFLAKYPRLSLRLSWLDKVFPGAVFIHMKRDWRAVVSSTVKRKLIREKKNNKWFGVYIPGRSQMGSLSHVEASARIFQVVTKTIENESVQYNGRFFSLSYEELCKEPLITIKRLAEQCDLAWCSEFVSTIPLDLKSANFKWKEQLDRETISHIRSEDPVFFERYEDKL